MQITSKDIILGVMILLLLVLGFIGVTYLNEEKTLQTEKFSAYSKLIELLREKNEDKYFELITVLRKDSSYSKKDLDIFEDLGVEGIETSKEFNTKEIIKSTSIFRDSKISTIISYAICTTYYLISIIALAIIRYKTKLLFNKKTMKYVYKEKDIENRKE